jgi:ankyrin repeat domain-containing protein 17
MLLLERGANIEEVNDEGYTPLMEAAREGHEEMVALLLSQVQNIANLEKKMLMVMKKQL